MIYAVIGIPCMVLTLKSTGEVASFYIKKLVIFTEKIICRKPTHAHVNVKCFMMSFLVFSLYLAVTAYFFQYVNGISYFEGFYAIFVTSTTIGFGDITMDIESLTDKYGSSTITIMTVVQIPMILFNLSTVSCFFDLAAQMLEKPSNVVTSDRGETTADDSNNNESNDDSNVTGDTRIGT